MAELERATQNLILVEELEKTIDDFLSEKRSSSLASLARRRRLLDRAEKLVGQMHLDPQNGAKVQRLAWKLRVIGKTLSSKELTIRTFIFELHNIAFSLANKITGGKPRRHRLESALILFGLLFPRTFRREVYEPCRCEVIEDIYDARRHYRTGWKRWALKAIVVWRVILLGLTCLVQLLNNATVQRVIDLYRQWFAN